MAEDLGDGFEVVVNGITMQRYETSKHMYNTYTRRSDDNLSFFDFCLQTWLNLYPLHRMLVDANMPELVREPYQYFRDMVIVGAQAELERIRGRWTAASGMGRRTVSYLRGWRNQAYLEFGPDPVVPDTEAEYYLENPAWVLDVQAPSPRDEPTSDQDS